MHIFLMPEKFSFIWYVISERAKRASSVTVHVSLNCRIYVWCKAMQPSVFYTCDRSTDPITEQKVKVQANHIIAHAQYKLL